MFPCPNPHLVPKVWIRPNYDCVYSCFRCSVIRGQDEKLESGNPDASDSKSFQFYTTVSVLHSKTKCCPFLTFHEEYLQSILVTDTSFLKFMPTSQLSQVCKRYSINVICFPSIYLLMSEPLNL